MQISTQMKVVLTQEELKRAAIDYVMNSLGKEEDVNNFTVEFEDDSKGDLTAIINIETSEDDGAGREEKKVVRRGRRTKAQIEEDNKKAAVEAAEAAQSSESTAEEPKEAKPSISTDPENRQEVQEEPAKPVEETATSNVTKIFPDNISSAAPSTPVPEVDPAVAAKSLFANLTKPTH